MIDCNGNDVTQESKELFDNLEERLMKSERQFENCDRCKQEFKKKLYKLSHLRSEIEDAAFDSQEIDGKHKKFMVLYLDDVLWIIDNYIESER